MGRTTKKTSISQTTRFAREFFARIDKRQKALAGPGKKLSDRATSIRSGLTPDFLNTMRKQFRAGKQTGVRSEKVEALAQGLETTTQWLLSGEGAEIAPDGDRHIDSGELLGLAEPGAHFGHDMGMRVPLIGYVRAGAEAVYLPLHENELDRVGAPPNATDRTRALEIRGDSLGELFDRWIVFFNDEERSISPDLVNKLCVVKLEDGRVLVKKIRRVRGGGYELLSNTEPPIIGATITWAAAVIDMRPQ
jgi:hypothetical protein